jgi:hypothetical protein
MYHAGGRKKKVRFTTQDEGMRRVGRLDSPPVLSLDRLFNGERSQCPNKRSGYRGRQITKTLSGLDAEQPRRITAEYLFFLRLR